MAFAVIQTGGKQYRVSPGSLLAVEKLDAAPGSVVTFDQVLLYQGEGEPLIGTPLVSGVTVTAEVISQMRDIKIRVFTYRPKKRESRRIGHRQSLTQLKVTDVILPAAKSTTK